MIKALSNLAKNFGFATRKITIPMITISIVARAMIVESTRGFVELKIGLSI